MNESFLLRINPQKNPTILSTAWGSNVGIIFHFL